MYPNYNMYRTSQNMYRNNNMFRGRNDDRFLGGGFVAPLLIGGIAGYALGRPNNQQCCGGYYYPYPYNPYQFGNSPSYYNNYFY